MKDILKEKISGKIVSLFLVVIIILSAMAGAWGYKAFMAANGEDKQERVTVTDTIVKEIITPLSELVTTEYKYASIHHEKGEATKLFNKIDIPFTTNEILFKYKGTIKVGVNLENVRIEVDDNSNTISLDLPEPIVISNEIDEIVEVYDQKNGLFKEFTLDDFDDMYQRLKSENEKELMQDQEFLSSVSKNTRSAIHSFLNQDDRIVGYTVYID